jgi:hypothetical protein
MKPFAVQVLQNLPQPVGYAILSALESRGLLGRKGPKVIEGTVVNALTTS